MLLSLRKNGLTSLFKEVRVFKEPERETGTVGTVFPETESGTGTAGTVFQEPKP